jgi:hypothetical protein
MKLMRLLALQSTLKKMARLIAKRQRLRMQLMASARLP